MFALRTSNKKNPEVETYDTGIINFFNIAVRIPLLDFNGAEKWFLGTQGNHNWTKKSKNHKNVKSKIKKSIVGRVKNIFFRFLANQVSDRLQETL